MERAAIIVGAGYGDEGKGLVTDYMCKGWADLIVRFNGGAQAAHTVKHADKEHVFGHIGSGSLSTGNRHKPQIAPIPTFLGPKFVVNPVLFEKEYKELCVKCRGPIPSVYMHQDCYVTTVFDMFLNRELEKRRGKNKHGSVGVGFNETITRNYDKGIMLQVKDLSNSLGVAQRIHDIGTQYVPKRLSEEGFSRKEIKELRDEYDFVRMQEVTISAITYMMANAIRCDESILNIADNVVFEGAQGLLLDEHKGVFPYVTRSSTGIENAWKLISKHKGVPVRSYYVTRAYRTRHGAGPLTHEEPMPKWVQDTTNVPHEFQGNLRYAPLDIDLLREAIHVDSAILTKLDIPGMNHLVVTCMDQIPNPVTYVLGGKIMTGTHEEFLKVLYDCIGYPMLLNHSAITPPRMAEF